MTGAQHFMTFDRRFFDFAGPGSCSYLLVRDFIGGTYSVIVNYDRAVRGRPVKKSLTIISSGHQLEVFPDGKLTTDGSRVEMPVMIGNTTVIRTGHMITVADKWQGVAVTCDLPHDHCSLAISGYVSNSFSIILSNRRLHCTLESGSLSVIPKGMYHENRKLWLAKIWMTCFLWCVEQVNQFVVKCSKVQDLKKVNNNFS